MEERGCNYLHRHFQRKIPQPFFMFISLCSMFTIEGVVTFSVTLDSLGCSENKQIKKKNPEQTHYFDHYTQHANTVECRRRRLNVKGSLFQNTVL